MVKRLLMVSLVVLCMASVAGAVTVGKATLPDSITVAGENLVLNGAGIREKKVVLVTVDIYAAGLYLKSKTTDAQAIIDADETMALKIQIISSLITSERFVEAVVVGFEEATGGNTAPIQKEIDMFLSVFAEEIKPDDVFDIQYVKGVGTKVYKNGKAEPEVVVAGLPIKKALFGIWLAPRTEKAMQNLGRDLLGISPK
ncbi:MAG: chalcone isomerase family protein [Thermodesulfobacteriota bacterium]|nr:chalcone isomerase family protein [Thermodesulfobacteriota bacterium]